ncbi:MAG: tetratricopeptide repeat protein [Actinobacteria bacterium]|nr:tetratricopeptide repeat protein [Actinomycetota bacterium]
MTTREADVDRLVELASAQLSSGDFSSATEVLLAAHELDPDNVPVLYNLGLAAQGLQEDDTGLDWYEQALALDPEHIPSLYNSAILLERVDLGDAIARYRRVIDLDPQAANAHMRLGFALQHLGEDDEAAEFLEEGLRLDPSMSQVEAPSYE